jgi:hypothetical protein
MGKTQKMGCHAFSGVPGAPRKWNSAAMTPRATMANTQSGTSRRRKRVYITRRMPSFSSEYAMSEPATKNIAGMEAMKYEIQA